MHPKIAENIGNEITSIEQVIKNLEFAKHQLYPTETETQTPRPPMGKGFTIDAVLKLDEQIKKANTVE